MFLLFLSFFFFSNFKANVNCRASFGGKKSRSRKKNGEDKGRIRKRRRARPDRRESGRVSPLCERGHPDPGRAGKWWGLRRGRDIANIIKVSPGVRCGRGRFLIVLQKVSAVPALQLLTSPLLVLTLATWFPCSAF